MGVVIKVLGAGEAEVLERIAPDVFDDPIDGQRAREFLADPRHHLVVALDEDVVVGFISAVEYVHPDKPSPELWINEVGVAESSRGQGIGKAMLRAALDFAKTRGCTEAWVLTERTNQAATRLYASLGGSESDSVMFTFPLP